jgi:hypothetical protein
MRYHPAIGWFSIKDYPPSEPTTAHNHKLTPSQWATSKLEFHPDPRQQQILDATANRILVNCSRQWGKSTTAAIKALHQALHVPKSLTLILSPSARQSGELFNKIKSFLTPLKLKPKSGARNQSSLLLDNQSRIVALPGNETTIRGFSAVSLLIVDEAARVPDTLYSAARPFLATTNGTLLVMSTPKGQSGFFYREWASTNDWLRISVPATECPRISPEFLASERAQSSDRYFRQEYMCDFLGAKSNLFAAEILERIHSTNFDPLNLKP